MLLSFFRNSAAKMTKEQYYEMCDALDTEPIESEIPIELEDFPTEVQEAFGLYYRLRDEWDTMNGIYLGKNYSGIGDILDILSIDKKDRKYLFELVNIIDIARRNTIQANKPKMESNQEAL